MNKQDWLKEAINYIDSLDSDAFEEFLINCVPTYKIATDYSDITHPSLLIVSKAANMDGYYSDDLILAA